MQPELPTSPSGLHSRSSPVYLSGPLPVGNECPYPGYTDLAHEVWRRLYTRQEQLLPGRAAAEFLAGLQALELERNRIPSLVEVSRQLKRFTNWRLARAPGLLDPGDFFAYLAVRIFPCTDSIRNGHEFDNPPGPDCFHDLFGHTPMLMHPRFADFYQKIGRAALHCREAAVMEGIMRIYWFTAEFGLIDQPGGLRAYGTSIITACREPERSLSEQVRVRPFRIKKVAQQSYDSRHLQMEFFVIRSFAELEDAFDAWCVQHDLR